MRGINSQKTLIRHRIFTEIARLAYEGGGPEVLEELPYRIIPGEISVYRDSIFEERAIIGERLRAAMGLSLQPITDPAPISKGALNSMTDEKFYEPPLIDIIKFACHRCPDKRVFVTDGCQGCYEHPCKAVCPKRAISLINGRSTIDPAKCIKCGKCTEACPYNAIIKQERPCAKACGINAISTDKYGRAQINYAKCVSCGQCLVSCPFGAIVDKGQIYQTIMALKSDTPVYAILAPAFAGQYGADMHEIKIRSAFEALGFSGVYEVAVGADMCTIEEAKDFLREVPDEIPYMGTSCCPAWSKMVKNEFPDQAGCISMALTPMVLTARLVKKEHPDCKVVFIGPCASKKLEASRRTVKSFVDFVLTFEEVDGMFDAKDITFADLPEGDKVRTSSADARGFAESGGVAKAVANYIKTIDPEREVKIVNAEGLADCRKMIMMAKAGKYNGYLLEGMACPGGCIAGAGTIAPIAKAKQELGKAKKYAEFAGAADTKYSGYINELEDFDTFRSGNKASNIDFAPNSVQELKAREEKKSSLEQN